MMGGEVYVEGRSEPVHGQLQPAEVATLLQKRDQFKRAWLHPNMMCLDCRSGKLFGDGHKAQLWDLVDSNVTLPSSSAMDYLLERKRAQALP